MRRATLHCAEASGIAHEQSAAQIHLMTALLGTKLQKPPVHPVGLAGSMEVSGRMMAEAEPPCGIWFTPLPGPNSWHVGPEAMKVLQVIRQHLHASMGTECDRANRELWRCTKPVRALPLTHQPAQLMSATQMALHAAAVEADGMEYAGPPDRQVPGVRLGTTLLMTSAPAGRELEDAAPVT